jgi:hypothetical protein
MVVVNAYTRHVWKFGLKRLRVELSTILGITCRLDRHQGGGGLFRSVKAETVVIARGEVNAQFT